MRESTTKPTTPTRPDAVQLRARRSPKLVAAGVLAVVLGALGFAFLWNSSHDHRAVVSVTDDVARGTVLATEHLEVVQVPRGFANDALAGEELEALVGQSALTDLPRGSFPLVSHVGDDPLPDGEALVGLRLTHGQLPTSGLPAGTAVRLVGTGEEPLEVAATVAVSPVLLDDGASFALDVRVAEADADVAARLAAREELALVALGGG